MGKPDSDPREYGDRERIHIPWSGWQQCNGQPFLRQEASPMPISDTGLLPAEAARTAERTER